MASRRRQDLKAAKSVWSDVLWSCTGITVHITSFLFLTHKGGILVSSGNGGSAASLAEMLHGKPQPDAYTGKQEMKKVQEHHLPLHQDWQANCTKT